MSPDPIHIRVAREGDADAIVSIVNEAYRAEAFFVAGDRISRADVDTLVQAGSCFVAEADGAVVACVQVEVDDGRGYFGMLAVRPDAQGRGIGRTLIAFAEATVRQRGCVAMDIKVVNLRVDLIRFYASLDYTAGGTEPYVHRPVLQPCHFVLMTKAL